MIQNSAQNDPNNIKQNSPKATHTHTRPKTIEKNIKYDVIISNPPYIPTNIIRTLKKEVQKHDPFVALNGGKDGLDAYKSILPKLLNIIKSSGKIFLEIGKGQENCVIKLAKEHGLLLKEFKKDLSGVTRVLIFIVK